MKRLDRVNKLAKAFSSLQIDSFVWKGTTLVDAKTSPTVIPCADGIFISAEDGKGLADYYGEGVGGYPWIHRDLETLAEELDVLIEWQDPGTLSIHIGDYT